MIKRFPPHLNSVSTVPCETCNAHTHVIPLNYYRKKLQNLSHCNCGLQIRQIWIQLITACGKYCKRRCIKHVITDLELSTTPLTNGCRNDDMIQLGPLRSQSLFQFIQISDAYFVHLLLQYSSNAVIKWIQIWLIWLPRHSWCANFKVSFCYNLMVATSISSFTMKCRDTIQVRWKTFTAFFGKFIEETVYQISSESPESYGKYYK